MIIEFNFHRAKPIKHISNAEGLTIAYNNPLSQYIYIYMYGDTLYLSGTRNIQDIYDDLTIPFNMVQHSPKYRDTEKLVNANPCITNIISHSRGASVAQKIKEKYPERDYNIFTYGSPNSSIFNKTPNNITRYKTIGDPIASLDRAAQVIGADTNSLKAHSYEHSQYKSGDTGGWVIDDTKNIHTPWDLETWIYTTPPIEQYNIYI